MNERLRRKVWRRAKDRCEYCQMPEDLDTLTFYWDHIIAQKHRGETVMSLLAVTVTQADNGCVTARQRIRSVRSRPCLPLCNLAQSSQL